MGMVMKTSVAALSTQSFPLVTFVPHCHPSSQRPQQRVIFKRHKRSSFLQEGWAATRAHRRWQRLLGGMVLGSTSATQPHPKQSTTSRRDGPQILITMQWLLGWPRANLNVERLFAKGPTFYTEHP
ncbi:hypothetical protein E2562_006035 [Oryza meyeriana var. granulata]|uniref:Uncharacterized protein n=1 Tax=Oryza meyeriana var. granulata TaxID=110450 RepID=A0A6G1EVL2_9ORYZ|nr:hypothetical protein E2562_006035 [Oryza meyeriana var. granulata]